MVSSAQNFCAEPERDIVVALQAVLFTSKSMLNPILTLISVPFVSARKVFSSLQGRGLRMTITLIRVRLAALIDLFLPRTIWGEHVGLRSTSTPLTDAQTEQVYEWARDMDILRWGASPPTELGLEEFRAKLRHERWHPQSNERDFYVVTRTGSLIGKIRFFSIDWRKGAGEIGIFLDKNYWSKHYARDAGQTLVRYIFTELPINRIYLGTFKDNIGAQRSAAAIGFRVVGSRGQVNQVTGEYRDGVEMELTRQDFLKQNQIG